jgi:hypothetical protein
LLNGLSRSTAEHRNFDGTRTIFDPDTGECLVAGPADTYKLVNIAQSEMYHERETFKGRQTDFTFTAMEAVGEVASVLSTAQCGYLLVLQCYVDYDSGRLVNADKSIMKTADMLSALKLRRKRSTFYAFMTSCVSNGIITETDGDYFVNPRYHFRGKARDTRVIRTYTMRVKQAYSDARKAADLGLVYKMLPYVNYEMNALCSNPLERDPHKIAWLSGQELARIIGVSESELSRRIRRVTVGDEYIIARITVGDCAKYMFNPNVFKRNSKPIDDTAQAMFNVKYRR